MQARHDRQRSICLTTSRVAGALVLQHLLDQIDAPARGIEFVAEQHIGRAGRGAEAAMHAGAQDLFRFRDLRIGQLGEGEGGLHRYTPAHMRPGLSTPLGSKLSFTRLVSARKRRRPAARTHRPRRAPRPAREPAWRGRRRSRPRARIAAASGSSANGIATQISPPAQS